MKYANGQQIKWIKQKGIKIVYNNFSNKFYACTKWHVSDQPNAKGYHLIKMPDDKQDVTDQIRAVVSEEKESNKYTNFKISSNIIQNPNNQRSLKSHPLSF